MYQKIRSNALNQTNHCPSSCLAKGKRLRGILRLPFLWVLMILCLPVLSTPSNAISRGTGTISGKVTAGIPAIPSFTPPHGTGTISGKVTGPDGVTPLQDVQVLCSVDNFNFSIVVWTDANGNYEFESYLAPGTYRVMFWDGVGRHLTEYFNNKSRNEANDIALADGQTVTGIDASLALGGQITGRVTGPDGVTPLEGVFVSIWKATGATWDSAGGGLTDADGNYHSRGLVSGIYRVIFIDHSGLHVSEYFNNKFGYLSEAFLYEADDIPVTVGQVVTGIDASLSLSNSSIAMSPMSGPPGTTFTEWGTGFTPNSTATLHFLKPDGTESPTLAQPIDAIGHFEITYTAPYDKPPGTHTWWGVDGATGNESNRVSYEITPLPAGLNVQTINPQSDQTLFNNFFPLPNPDLLISGGGISTVIAADGESCLLLRIVADSDPGLVTITESGQDTQQNGSISDLDHYRDGSTASSVDVELKPYGSRFIGFAVYRAPKDFSISDYENRLTRPITLDVTSAGGNLNIPLTLRRPPIIISHGLWSSGPGNSKIESFRDALWNRFEDRGGKNVDDYIYLNDCLYQNAMGVLVGANKTRSNIQEYLGSVRNHGATVTQVDYLGHSMGGQWGRIVEQRYGKDTFTYEKGYLHKLITLDTPHEGSFCADIIQSALDTGADIPIIGGNNARDYLCAISDERQSPVCRGAIKDLTSQGTKENLKEISVPCHAITGNKHIDSACDLLSPSTWLSDGGAEPIVTMLQVANMILKIINPLYVCDNWFNQFVFSTETDLIVGLDSQKGGLSGNQLSQFEHIHWASFYGEVNLCFFDLLNKGINDDAFAPGFPASSTLLDSQRLLALKTASTRLLFSSNQTALGNIQFLSPVDGSTVQPGEVVNVALALTGTLALKNVLIMAPGSDAVELVNPPYATAFTVPADAYGAFVLSVLGEGTDGNLYAASATLSVNNTAALQKVDVSQSLYLDLGQQMAISVMGTYSDGTVRDLNTGAQGTTYASSDENMLSVSSDGMVTPKAVGVGYVQVKPAASEPVIVRVEIFGSHDSYIDTVQKVYIAYYLRPADPGGLYWWAQQLNTAGGNMNAIIDAYANSEEAIRLWGTINSSNIGNLIDDVYWGLFNRAPDTGGKQYYVNGFNSGTFTPGTIVLNILNGAQNEDADAIANKLNYCNKFVLILDPDGDYQGPYEATYNADDEQTARDMLSNITCDSDNITSQQVKQDVIDYIADPSDPILN